MIRPATTEPAPMGRSRIAGELANATRKSSGLLSASSVVGSDVRAEAAASMCGSVVNVSRGASMATSGVDRTALRACTRSAGCCVTGENANAPAAHALKMMTARRRPPRPARSLGENPTLPHDRAAAPQHRLCISRRHPGSGLRLRGLRRMVLAPRAANRSRRAVLHVVLRPRSAADVRILEGIAQRRRRARADGCGWSGGVAVHAPRLVAYDVRHVHLAVDEL